MKKIKLYFLVLLSLCMVHHGVNGQPVERCGTDGYLEQLKSKYPETGKRLQKLEEGIQRYLQSHSRDFQRSGGTITIPVVVHVVYQTPQQNISDQQILSQIDVLNEDFRRLNADAANTPAAFQGVAADVGIEFCLAVRDPQGNPTTGITRTQTNVSTFFGDEVKQSSQGGKDGWPNTDYLNIWVCNLGGGTLGYATFPNSGPAWADGVVIGYNYFGRTGTLSAPYNKGRTTTHEVGHWLGLYHIWGSSGGCSDDDQVNDTPNSSGPYYGCPSYPQSSCGSDDMFMNYMDYTDDACMNLFTNGQKNRILAVLNNYRASILNSNGCVPVNLPDYDAAVVSIISPKGQLCENAITPEFQLRNLGNITLTSLTITYTIDGANPYTYQWTGNLPSLATTTVVLPSIAVTPGNHSLEIAVSNPNGNTDANTSNDVSVESFTIISGAGLALPFSEDFESATFPPAGWTLENPDGDYTWELTSQAGSQSNQSMYINHYDYMNGNGQWDVMTMPDLDFSGYADPVLTFDLAYALYSATGYSDTLILRVSTDCGATFTTVYKKYSNDLTTAPLTTDPFVPAPSQWRTDTVDLSQFSGKPRVTIQWVTVSDYENNLYIDNINIYGTTPIVPGFNSGLNEPSVSVYPIPAGEYLYAEITGLQDARATIKLVNLTGKTVLEQQPVLTGRDVIRFHTSDLPAGFYLLTIDTGKGGLLVRKVLID